MNIVYGVSGEGLGHVFEAIEVAALLQRDGHDVKVLTYGDRACRSLAAFHPTRIEGIHLCFGEKGLSLPRTLLTNLRVFPFYWKNTRRLLRELADFHPDAFLTAYEPFTTFASHRIGKPLISMDNQNELRLMRRPTGADFLAFHLARLTTRVVTYGAAHYIVKTFNRQAARSDRLHLVAPIIQQEIRRLEPTTGSHVLVYLTKENPALIAVLKTLPEAFVVYCHDRVGEDHNITYRAQGSGYVRDLGGCKAVIATAGFSLIADAIYLRKPYFGVPLKKQFEQTLNARFLAASGMGEFSENPTREELNGFFSRLPEYRQRMSRYNLNPSAQEEKLRELLARLGGPGHNRANQ